MPKPTAEAFRTLSRVVLTGPPLRLDGQQTREPRRMFCTRGANSKRRVFQSRNAILNGRNDKNLSEVYDGCMVGIPLHF